jgi:O-antigen ligase
MPKELFGKIFRGTLLYIIVIELFSLFVHQFGAVLNLRIIAFTLLLAIIFVLGRIKLEYALYAALLELFIGSQGHLFNLNIHGFPLSIRIGIFCVILILWLFQTIKNKQLPNIFSLIKKNKPIIAVAVVVGWGIIVALIRGNQLPNIFLDVNAWIYFLYLFPLLTIIQTKKQLLTLLQILGASIIALVVKTFFFLYAFAHELPIVPMLYKWGRDTRWGEFTVVHDNVYRIFAQSHIFLLIIFFVLLGFLFFRDKLNLRITKIQYLFIFLFATLSVVITNLSRSFWVAGLGALALTFFLVLLTQKEKLKKIFYLGATGLILFILSYGLILSVLNFPIPAVPLVDASDIFGTRLNAKEAAISSRQSQLKPILTQIANHPLLGSGWGTEVTYKSDDPRIKNEKNPEGWTTTYAFEWGYLDIILKIGLLGLIIYLILIYTIVKQLYLIYKKSSDPELRALIIGLNLGLFALLGVHMFTPYLNHPLGIGYLLLLLTLIEVQNQKSKV